MKSARLHEFQKQRFYKYIASAFIVGLATFVQDICWDVVRPDTYMLYYPAVIFASIYADGMTAIILSMFCAQYFFTEPYFQLTISLPGDPFRLVIFFFTALSLKVLVKALYMAKLEAEDALAHHQEERELREKFVSTLTHDLQTPLTTAKLATQLILKNPDADSIKRNTERVLSNLNRIENMIRDLLDTNKIRAGKKLPLKVEEIDICQYLRVFSSDLATIHGDRFQINTPEKVVGFWCVDALRRITENLCTNAVKYGSETGPITLSIEVEEQSIHLKVHNLGDTIPHEELELLFKPFERSKYTRGKKGWGLGLTLVKGLTEAQGGQITVTSDETGTTFIVTLPRDVREYVEEIT